jgi:hypothetical protein
MYTNRVKYILHSKIKVSFRNNNILIKIFMPIKGI